MLEAAARHRGSAFVEILQNCNIYNDNAFDFVREEKGNRIYLEDGAQIRFGLEGEKGVVQDSDGSARVVDAGEAGDDALLVHDASQREPSLAFALSRITYETDGAVPLGVFRSIERAVYDDLMAEQLESARETSGAATSRRCSTPATPGSFPANGIPRGSGRCAPRSPLPSPPAGSGRRRRRSLRTSRRGCAPPGVRRLRV